ncbi:MAG: efflux RND transporter periplasmic adaptor subunit [Deltaproteobacteria bacterium]|nr:efflux RND transporter periplasmic adaptor subunit [Deltaproteobacteria bacterium]
MAMLLGLVGQRHGDSQAADTYYTCPMHPTIVQDEPGTCPVCGMDLVHRHSARHAEEKESKKVESSSGTISVDPVMVQNMGVRVAKVLRGSIYRTVRAIGEVEVAEDQLSVVNLRFSGWVERMYADQTGQEVKRGQALFSIYSPELVSAQKEYLLAYNTSGKQSDLTRAAAERLLLWGIPSSALQKVVDRQNVDRTAIIRAPRTGFILHKNVVEGARVGAGRDLYRIGNLKQIWVLAEVYEFDAPWIRVGQKATMELSFQRGRIFDGQVDYIYPTLNKRSRTLSVRLQFPNPGIRLKPGMFATVRIEAQRKEGVLVVPTESIIHSGERQIVFVTRAVGKYRPQEIVTGMVGKTPSSEGRSVTEVLSGLDGSETVVTSGQFLLDSESQLQEAVQKMLEARLQARKDTAQPSASSREGADPSEEHGEAFWTCPMHPQIVQAEPGTCPICGMDLVEKKR